MSAAAQRAVLQLLQGSERIWWSTNDLAAASDLDQAHVVTAVAELEASSHVELAERTREVLIASEKAVADWTGEILDVRILQAVSKRFNAGEAVPLSTLKGDPHLRPHEVGIAIGLLKDLGVTMEQGAFQAPGPERMRGLEAVTQARNVVLEGIIAADGVEQDQYRSVEQVQALENLRARGLVTTRTDSWREVALTPAGRNLDAASIQEVERVTQLTPELLQSGRWRDLELKPYDVTLDVPTPVRGRTHPLAALIQRIRRIFLSLGFHELEDTYVQSTGWNMDALFIPQDHPAREMQDTFYLDTPKTREVEDHWLDLWSAVHEHGGETGSTGWGGTFDRNTAQQGVLRTHTTVATIRHLAQHPEEPCRVFGVDRVFRKESIDRTHLPEFHQIEGIIMEPGANLPMLIGTLREFYAQMGLPDVRVRPAYFPYTEPSLEIEVKWRGQWLELGGAGIFRPEVTEPLGCIAPVLAWGMGLERLAMLVLGLDDIRQLYISDLEWLRSGAIM